jgi:hypothetical protein
MVKSVLLAVFTVASPVDGNGNLFSVKSTAGTAGPMGQASFRDGIVRADQGIPGYVESFSCDWCVHENVPRQPLLPGCLNGGCPERGWWTENPAAHWDSQGTFPSIPCMSFDAYGKRGTLVADAGEILSVDLYINVDYGGFYRYEYVSFPNPTNEEFMNNPVSPWYSLHSSAETAGVYPGRVVGYTKANTEAYLYDMDSVPGVGLGQRSKNPSHYEPGSSFCLSNFTNCFFRDSVPLPSGIEGQGVLRWNWVSAVTNQVRPLTLDFDFFFPLALDLTLHPSPCTLHPRP